MIQEKKCFFRHTLLRTLVVRFALRSCTAFSVEIEAQLPCKGCRFPTWVPSTDPLHFFFRVKDCWLALYSLVAEESPLPELASSKMVEQLMKQQTNSKTPHQQLPKISVVATFGATKIVCRMTAILSLHVVLRQCEPPGHISTFLEPYVDVH